MKPDGLSAPDEAMDPSPTEVVAGEKTSSLPGAQEEVTQQTDVSKAQGPEEVAVPPAAQEANSKPVAVAVVLPLESKGKTKAVSTKAASGATKTGASGLNSRPGAASNRTGNEVKTTNNAPAKKTTTVRTQVKVVEKKPVGTARTTPAAASATVANNTRQANGTPKKKLPAGPSNGARPTGPLNGARPTGAFNGARPKTTAPASTTVPKPSISTVPKAEKATGLKTNRTITGTRPPSSTAQSKPTTAPSKPVAVTKPSTSGTGRPARVTTAPSAGRATTTQPPKPNAVAKKDVSRPASATAAKRPAMATSAATKKMEPSKPAPASRPIPASKRPLPLKAAEVKAAEAKAAEAKPTARTKILDSSKPTAAKKTASPGPRPTANNRLPLGRKPLSSPANKSKSQAKDVPKPTLSDTPSAASKEPEALNSSAAVVATVAGVVAAVSSVAESTAMPVTVQGEVEAVGPELPSAAMSGAEKGHSEASAEDSPLASSAADTCLPHSPERTSPDQDLSEITAPLMAATGQILVGAPLFESANQPSTEHPLPPTADQDPSTSNVSLPVATITPLVISSSNLNEVEEEEEEEREGSQQVSESEMSGTTQPTEESRPGSAGPVGGAAWRAGGALLSELDSEEVSGSQQGASELSAPGVLEGTESMDDLGDASLKGAIDMEGASAGSPDILPDIPVNDFEEDEDDDRVCDMDVGSERAEDPQRPRHDNEVEDEDEDVEMASEAVTESGLESYGNADEDDFAEDERLDNLNRVALPPPPPQLPSALAAQWDQPNPFSDPWAQPFEPQQSLQQVAEPLQPSAVGLVPTSPTEPLQADSETPTQSPAQAWLELGTASFVPPNHHSTVPEGPLNSEGQSCMDQFGPVPMHALAPAHLSAPGLSQSSTLSSDTSTPEDLCDFNQEAKLQLHTHAGPAPMLSLQHDPEDQDLGIHLEREDQEEEEAEAETLPADDVLSGPATAPTSNPSSNSTTEDEASDTEGEAQLEVPLRGQDFLNETFEMPPQRQPILSTVEEAEEEATPQSVCGDTTPPSANSAASYGFDTMTTYSNSNAASTGESCNKSPGIFSLEELPEEAMAPCLLQDPQSLPEPPFAAEQHYMQCGNLAEELTENVGMEGPGSEVAFGFTPSTPQQLEDDPDDAKPAYYSAICEKTENSVAGLRALPHPHAAHPRPHCDMVKPLCNSVKPHYDIVKPICDIIKAPSEAATLPRLSCADLPPRNSCAQAVSPQLRRLEQHQRQLLELQQRREQPSRPSCESKEAGEEEVLQGSQKEEDEEEKANEEVNGEEDEETGGEEAGEQEELQEQRRDLQLQLQQQQEELQQRQQIMQWQQELEQQQQPHVGQSAVLLSPSSGLCTIYEALENSEDEAEEKEPVKVLKVELQEQKSDEETQNKDLGSDRDRVMSDNNGRDSSTSSQSPPPPDSPRRPADPQYPHILGPLRDQTLSCPPLQSPERPPPLDLDWGKKVDIVQQLINQTLLLTGDGCSSLLLLPGGAGGTLSPLESSLWPSMLPPLTPPSATVTSVSSFSPEAPGSSPQGEWTVVELETHH